MALPRSLDAPITLEYTAQDPRARYPLANLQIHYRTDRDSDLYGLTGPGHGHTYARSIRLQIQAPIYTRRGIRHEPVEAMQALVTRQYPGYVETIAGVEGVIVSKRTFPPLDSAHDRAALWMLECQAEGDRLLQVRVAIDWGEPLEQRMVDGLLVAQGRCRPQDVETTRVFGMPEGRPDQVAFPAPSQARLLYHVLVVGQVDLAFLLTVSHEGEEGAWQGFLALRDIRSVHRRTQAQWWEVTHRGRLWSPWRRLDWAVQQAKIRIVHRLKRLSMGLAPLDEELSALPAWVDACHLFEPSFSHDLLATVRELVHRTQGHLPSRPFPATPQGPAPPPDPRPLRGYLEALHRRLARDGEGGWLAEHQEAIRLCAEALIRGRRTSAATDPRWRLQAAHALQQAAALLARLGHSADPARWSSEAQDLAPDRPTAPTGERTPFPPTWWETGLDLLSAPVFLARVMGSGCGIHWEEGRLHLTPTWPPEWSWWALLDLPTSQGLLSLLWDGQILHTTRPVVFPGPVRRHGAIQARGTDPDAFDLHFRTDGGEVFRPPGEGGR